MSFFFCGDIYPKRKFKHEKIENEVIIKIFNHRKTEEKRVKITMLLYLAPICSLKYKRMIKILYLHIWFMDKFG
jgi:hypothetical protein